MKGDKMNYMSRIMLLGVLLLAGCNHDHTRTLYLKCQNADGSKQYTLNQYKDRLDDANCVSNGYSITIQYRYQGDSEHYQDLCPAGGETFQYIGGKCIIQQTKEELPCAVQPL